MDGIANSASAKVGGDKTLGTANIIRAASTVIEFGDHQREVVDCRIELPTRCVEITSQDVHSVLATNAIHDTESNVGISDSVNIVLRLETAKLIEALLNDKPLGLFANIHSKWVE